MAAAALLLAPGALAASSPKDATVQGYGGPVVAVTKPAAKQPAAPAAAAAPAAVEYCRDASGNLLDARGNVVASTSQAAPASAGCYTAPEYCVDASGNLLDAQGNVVSSTSEAAPAGAGCARKAGVAPANYTAPKPVKAQGTLPFTGAELGVFAVIGLALIGSGILLRMTARQKSPRS